MTSRVAKNMRAVEALLPAPDESPAHPAEIYERFGLGALNSMRTLLRRLEAAGRAQSVLIMNSKSRMPMRLYRRAG
jgi:hypothetical protein